MRICIVIQSEAFRTSAGMRIRYDRLRETLAGSDVTIDSATCAELVESKALDHDVYVFCKTFDTGALVLARRMRSQAKVVGQDLFDDYFSQTQDSRLQRYRDWLRDMAPVTDFAICSTPRMVEVVRSYLPGIPVTAVGDPIIGFDIFGVAAMAEQKVAKARETRSLDVVWFGIGDNPFYPVGLTDLAACDPTFALMQRLGWTVNLTIMTNRRPFERAGGEVLRPLSIPFEVVEWTEEGESQALGSATVAIIPVSGQAFSRAKSLNRAVTGLAAGCQVLTSGFPLYEPLGEFIYDSPGQLLDDIDRSECRVRTATAERLQARLAETANPRRAAAEFVAEARRAFESVGKRARTPDRLCVLHGRSSAMPVHKTVGALGGFSIKTPFSTAAWNFPVRFDRSKNEVVMRVTTAIAADFELPLRETHRTHFGIFDFVDVNTEALGVDRLAMTVAAQRSPILDLAIYEDVMRFATLCCRSAFPGADVLLSDSSIFARRPRISANVIPRRPRRLVSHVAAGGSKREVGRGGGPQGRSIRAVAILRRKRSSRSDERAAALLARSPLFDAKWYLATYPDVAVTGADPLRHYLEFGWYENRNPSAEFSTKAYLKANGDVAEQGINPLVHYLEYGEREGRKAPRVKAQTSS